MKKKIIIGVILVLCFCFVLAMCGSTDDQTNYNETYSTEETSNTEETTADLTSNYTMEEENCYDAALSYLDALPFSKKGLIDQLSSEYGDNYPKEVAEKIVNDIEKEGKVDWDKECEEAAQSYLDTMPFSKEELIDQLSSEYGESFTTEQAEKAVDKVYK